MTYCDLLTLGLQWGSLCPLCCKLAPWTSRCKGLVNFSRRADVLNKWDWGFAIPHIAEDLPPIVHRWPGLLFCQSQVVPLNLIPRSGFHRAIPAGHDEHPRCCLYAFWASSPSLPGLELAVPGPILNGVITCHSRIYLWAWAISIVWGGQGWCLPTHLLFYQWVYRAKIACADQPDLVSSLPYREGASESPQPGFLESQSQPLPPSHRPPPATIVVTSVRVA